MCDPLTVAGLAFTLGSTFLSQRAANKVERSRNKASVAEIGRQEQFQQAAAKQVLDAQGNFTPERQNEGIEAAAQERIDRLQGNVTGGEGDPNDIPFAPSAPNIVRETAAKAINKGLGEGKNFAARLGRLGAFGENQFGNQVDLLRLGEGLNNTGKESVNSANILGLELNRANRAGDSLTGFADALGGVGSVANLASAAGANPFAGALDPASITRKPSRFQLSPFLTT